LNATLSDISRIGRVGKRERRGRKEEVIERSCSVALRYFFSDWRAGGGQGLEWKAIGETRSCRSRGN
jgi:hypothetical protein